MIAEALWLLTGMQAPLCLNALLNAATFRALPPLAEAGAGVAGERVSVLVPARNEAARLGALLESFIALDACLSLELLVYDDDSSDGTAALVRAAEARDPRVRLLVGVPLPPGWGGKTHALHRLAQAARGDWLLFVDADVVLEPGCVARAIAAMQRDRLDVLSLYPRQVLGSWGERIFVPCMIYYFHLLGSQWLLRLGLRPAVVALNGQFMLYRRAAYEAVGGYASIREAWLDDMTIASRLVAQGQLVAYRSGRGLARCRMYTSFAEAWQGFAKHTWDSFAQPAPIYLAVHAWLFLAGVAVWLAPLSALWWPWGPAEGRAFGAIAAMTLIGRSVSCHQAGNGWWSALLHPFSLGGALLNGLASYQLARRRESTWKGRTRGAIAAPPPPGA